MVEPNALRGVCKEFREAVTDFPLTDGESVMKGSVRAWRAPFPAARAVNVSTTDFRGHSGGRRPIVDSDFVLGDARERLHICEHDMVHQGHGCSLRAPARDPKAQHGLLRPGDNHGRCL